MFFSPSPRFFFKITPPRILSTSNRTCRLSGDASPRGGGAITKDMLANQKLEKTVELAQQQQQRRSPSRESYVRTDNEVELLLSISLEYEAN